MATFGVSSDLINDPDFDLRGYLLICIENSGNQDLLNPGQVILFDLSVQE